LEKTGNFYKKWKKMEISKEETKKISISLKETKTNFWFKFFFKKDSKILTKRFKNLDKKIKNDKIKLFI